MDKQQVHVCVQTGQTVKLSYWKGREGEIKSVAEIYCGVEVYFKDMSQYLSKLIFLLFLCLIYKLFHYLILMIIN